MVCLCTTSGRAALSTSATAARSPSRVQAPRLAARGQPPAIRSPRARPAVAVRVANLPRSAAGSTVDPFSSDCPERDDVSAFQTVAMDYFAQVGSAEPSLSHVMEADCTMTDRVLGWCFPGREAVEQHFRDFHSKYTEHEFCHLDVLTNLKERTVCAHWALTVVPRVEGDPCLSTKTAQITGVHIFRLNSDKIAGITTYRTQCNSDALFQYD